MPALNSLRILLSIELHELQSIEQQLVKVLPKMIAAADNQVLQRRFAERLDLAHARILRLQEFAGKISLRTRHTSSRAGRDVINEAIAASKLRVHDLIRDARLIAVSQRIANLERTSFATGHLIAQELGEYALSNFLQHAADEETTRDAQLTTLSAIVHQQISRATAPAAPAPAIGLGQLRPITA